MTTLQFADTHNLVAFLSKPAESEGFEQIATAKVKTINEEVQLQALVDGKKIIVTEASVRRDLQLNDEEGTDCLPNATIFEELTRMGYEKLSQKLTFYKAFFSPQWKFLIHTILQCLSAKTTAWNEFSSTMASVIICLATNQKFNFSKYIFETQEEIGEGSINPTDPHHTPTIIQPSTSQPQKKQKPRKLKRKDTEVPQPSGHTDNVADEAVYEEMDDSLERAATTATSLDAEQDRGNINKTQSKATHNEPSSLGTSLGSGPRRQETIGDTIAQTSLKRRVKRLEKKGGSRNHRLKRLYKVGLSRRVESSDEEGLGEEDASKQGRIADIDANARINLVSTHFDADTDMFGVDNLVGDEVVVESEVSIKAASIIPVSATTTTTTVITDDEITLAKALAKLRSAKLPTTTAVTTITADKGKAKMVEPELVKKLSKKDQLMLNEELAFKLQAEEEEEEEEERLAREKAQQIEEANIVSWDNVQAMIDADYQMALQMHVEEQEKLSIEEKSMLFIQLLEARKKHFAEMRAQEKRNKPPTKAQKRNIMSTYLKNMAGYKNTQLKNKSFDDIQKLFDKAMKRVNTFVDMETELVEGSEVRAEGSKTRVEGSSKRAGEELEQESSKKQKLEEDKETTKLQRLIEIVPDKEEVAIDAIPLATKPPSIVDYKIHKERKKTYYQIIRADGSSKMYLGDLKTMFDPHVEDQVWRNQQDYRVLDWKLYDSCGVHSLRKQNVHMHMLVEKRYPLTAPTIIDMLNRKLQADH
ncbi:hypothetical protein Tco_1207272 [Tanacetum coccineum]